MANTLSEAPFAEPLPISREQSPGYLDKPDVLVQHRSPIEDVKSLTEMAERLASPIHNDPRTPIFNDTLAAHADAILRKEKFEPLHPALPRIINATYEIHNLRNEVVRHGFGNRLSLLDSLKWILLQLNHDTHELLIGEEIKATGDSYDPVPGFVRTLYTTLHKGHYSWHSTSWYADRYDPTTGKQLEEVSYLYTIANENGYRDGLLFSQKTDGPWTQPRMLDPANPYDLNHIVTLDTAVGRVRTGVKDKLYKK